MFRTYILRRNVNLLIKTQKRTRAINDNDVKVNRQIHCGICLRNPRYGSKSNNDTSPALANKYQVITDDNSTIIENTAEEIHSQNNPYPLLNDEFDGINLTRGKSGVFEIEDLVEVLKRENSRNIFVASVPEHIRYVDYICIVSGRSKRHIGALAEFVRRVYKKKCHEKDYIPIVEGKNSDEWMALDLGNIALHIFSEKARELYDLETLWSVGPEFDEQTSKKSDVADVFESYSAYLKDLRPLS